MKKIKNYFKKKKASIVLKTLKKEISKNGQKITEWEVNFFNKNGWQCPNCEKGHLYEGPSGGMSTNIRCRICGQGYNITPILGLENTENIGIDESWIDEQYIRSLKLNKIKNETTRKN